MKLLMTFLLMFALCSCDSNLLGNYKARSVFVSKSRQDVIDGIKNQGLIKASQNYSEDNGYNNYNAYNSGQDDGLFVNLADYLATQGIEFVDKTDYSRVSLASDIMFDSYKSTFLDFFTQGQNNFYNSRYSLYYRINVGDGFNMDIDQFFPIRNTEYDGDTIKGFIQNGIGFGTAPAMFGLDLLSYEDIGFSRMTFLGKGHSHMMKGTAIKRVYQKTLEISVYDKQKKQTVIYMKAEGIGECPYFSKELLQNYLDIMTSSVPKAAEEVKTMSVNEGNCNNSMYSNIRG